jgi:hypothetical protein
LNVFTYSAGLTANIRQNGTDIFRATANYLKTNTQYQVKFIYKNNQWEAYLKENNGDFVKLVTAGAQPGYDEEGVTFENIQMVYGRENAANYMRGLLDLPQTTLISDGKEIFTGTKPVHLLERRKPKVWNKGQFTVVGNPSISESGVASGFSSSNYLRTKLSFLGNEIEITMPINTTNITTNQYLLNADNKLRLDLVYVQSADKIFPRIYLYDGTNQWYIRPNVVGLEANKNYIAKFKYNISTNTASVFLYSEDGALLDKSSNHPTNAINLSFSNVLTKIGESHLGSIDLKQFKIYTDNNLVFDGGAETYVYDPSKFTVVGTPTITEYGVASGIFVNSSSNIDFSSSPTKWTIVSPTYKITTAATGVLIPFLWGNASTGNINFSLRPNGMIGMNYNNTTGTGIAAVSGTNVVQLNTDIQCKWDYDNGTITMSYKIGNGDWVVLKTATVSACTSSGVIEFSRISTNGCTCDLKTGSVTVDGKEVFTGAKENYYVLRS